MTGLGEQLPGAEAERPKGRIPSNRRTRIMIEQARLLTLKTAWMMDHHGNKAARAEMAMIKVAAPNMARRVIDWAIQAFGGAAVTSDYGLAYAYPAARVLRLADGPDEVHRNQIAQLGLRKYQGPTSVARAARPRSWRATRPRLPQPSGVDHRLAVPMLPPPRPPGATAGNHY